MDIKKWEQKFETPNIAADLAKQAALGLQRRVQTEHKDIGIIIK